MVMSDFRPEMEIWLFCACHNYRNSSVIVDLSMGQIPHSTERITSFYMKLLGEKQMDKT